MQIIKQGMYLKERESHICLIWIIRILMSLVP